MSEDIKSWALEIEKKIINKMHPVILRNRNVIPYTTENGNFVDLSSKDINWWTNGFWGGILWQMFVLTGEDIYKEEAELVEKKLDKVLMDWNGLDHDNGFKWLPTAVAHYRIDRNEESLNRGLLAANNLAGRFNIKGNYIRAWNNWGDVDRRGMAIIDCMMNLPLLYWASDVTDDPRFKHIAMEHAQMAMKYFVREDGSVNHIIRFDPEDGKFIESIGGQGYGVGSSWTRGQSWGIYGFTLSYIHTGEKAFLNTAKKIADYYISNIPEDGLIPVDFRQPKEPHLEDSTSAAIAACGFIELYKALSKSQEASENEKYINSAYKLLKVLSEKRCIWDEKVDNILEKCTAAYHDEKHEFSIIYGDYYFIEAVMKITGKELFIW
ncbi:MAG: glycoside hydrolase family 88 protein [Butyrivibrio sp.]|nr:glycoside hydrolase family 88 protein [Butyrivibrio sp.]